jgi:hypothetical protein
MYCKDCGHRDEAKAEKCARCGVSLTSTLALGPTTKQPIRWRRVGIVAVIAIAAFAIVPRLFFRSELESIGPTDKLRFLRALEHSQYKRSGQGEFRVEGQTLIVIWDLRWQTLPERTQADIVRIYGRAWHVVGGETTRFRMEGDEKSVAEYRNEKVVLAPEPQADDAAGAPVKASLLK